MTYSAPIIPGLRGELSSEDIREEFNLIATEFALMPPTLGVGSEGFTGGQWTNALLTNPTITLGIIGSNTQPCTIVSGFHVFAHATYTTLGSGNVGFVRNSSDGRLKLYDGAVIKSFWDNAQNFVMGTGASEYGTTSASGFFYPPTFAGVMTGTPTTYIGAAAMGVDRTNSALGFFIDGAWRFAGIPYTGSVTYDPGSLADGAGVTTTVTVTGAALGMFADAAFSLDLQGITVTAWVSAANTVSVRFQNESGGVLDLASGTLKARACTK